MKSVDILVAVRNEEKSIPEFIGRLNELAQEDIKINIIFLEDGSSDGTIDLLKDLSQKFNNVDFVSLENKYGQYAALSYGLTISDADAIITMDVDGGHPIETAMEMIVSYLNGYNLVQGHRITYKRKQSYRTVMSYAYNLFFYIIVGVNFFKQNVMFRLMDKSTKEKFIQNKNWWHIFKTNFKSKDGIKTSYIEYAAPERELGESKYGFLRLLKLSYKSFFALLSINRLILVNAFLIILIFLFFNFDLIVIALLISILVVELNVSFYLIINNYPVHKLKIIDTSLPGLKDE